MTAAENFHVDIDVEHHRVQPVGELDMATAPSLVQSVGILTDAEIVALDLSRVTFLDAAGLGAIVAIRIDLAAVGGTLVLTGIQPGQARVFLMAGLASLLPHRSDE